MKSSAESFFSHNAMFAAVDLPVIDFTAQYYYNIYIHGFSTNPSFHWLFLGKMRLPSLEIKCSILLPPPASVSFLYHHSFLYLSPPSLAVRCCCFLLESTL